MDLVPYAIPFFFLAMGIEFAYGLARGRNTYRVADTLASIGAGVFSQVTGLITRGVLANSNQPLDPKVAVDVDKEFGSQAQVITFEELRF